LVASPSARVVASTSRPARLSCRASPGATAVCWVVAMATPITHGRAARRSTLHSCPQLKLGVSWRFL